MIERFDSCDPDALGNRLDVVLQRRFGARVTKVCLDIFNTCDLSHVGRAGAPEHLAGDAADSGLLARSLEDPEEKLFVLIAVPRAEGKMNASGAALLVTDIHHSSSASMDIGSQTFVLLPSVLVSTSIPSVILLSMRRLFCALSFHRSAKSSPGRSPSTRNIRTIRRSRSLRLKRTTGICSGVRWTPVTFLPERGTASFAAGFLIMNSSSSALSRSDPGVLSKSDPPRRSLSPSEHRGGQHSRPPFRYS